MRIRGAWVSLVEGRSAVDTHGLRPQILNHSYASENEGRRVAYLASITFAGVERTITIVARHVPCTAHHIVDVLAKSRSIRSVYARAQTEFISGHKVL